ncbi:hypothetical protein [Salinibius halmophilus]|uniref:hypothetical protein n=1 Tax=Salinibius halmophilus TaxID=1853216 RepID=UPI000E663718|nr:hypothetical protein [Salinibius halmophilus]
MTVDNYLALFPAFVNLASITITNVIGIMICATLAFGSVNLGYSLLAGAMAKQVKQQRTFSKLQKLAGAVMAATGASVALRA